MKKLKIHNIKIQSFITNLEQKQQETVKGGSVSVIEVKTEKPTCSFNSPECYNDNKTKYPICQVA